MKEALKWLLQGFQDGAAEVGQVIGWIAQNLELTAICAGGVVLALAILLAWRSRRHNKRTGHFTKRKAE